jgi:hypothetical protein
MWDVISTIVNSPKPKKDERQGYWVRSSKGTTMALEKPGESRRRASHRKPKRSERSPSDEARNSPSAKYKVPRHMKIQKKKKKKKTCQENSKLTR